ncbi:MAG: PIN domain-containing protein [bacterium]
MNRSCLVDSNIVLDIIERRERYFAVKKILASYDSCYISVNSYLNLFYVLRKTLRDKEKIINATKFLDLLDATSEACKEAVIIGQIPDDIEDCFELSLAKSNDLDFITADKKITSKYSGFYKSITLVQ